MVTLVTAIDNELACGNHVLGSQHRDFDIAVSSISDNLHKESDRS